MHLAQGTDDGDKNFLDQHIVAPPNPDGFPEWSFFMMFMVSFFPYVFSGCTENERRVRGDGSGLVHFALLWRQHSVWRHRRPHTVHL